MDTPKLAALPPRDAIAYFAAKGYHLEPTFAWQDLWQELHTAAFTVAKSTGFDILGDIHSALVEAMQQGQTFETFRDQLTPILQAKGWWGRQTVQDPLTQEIVTAQLGSERRLKTIFDVNLRVSNAAATWAQIERHKAARPYLRYSAILDAKTRPMHREWHGTVLKADDPWWQDHFPPNGWFCRCTVQTLSDQDLARYGLTPSTAAPKDGPDIVYTNPRTGAVSKVPPGVDPGWGYNPGKSAVDVHTARLAANKWGTAWPPLTAASQAAGIRFLAPLLTKDFSAWVTGLANGVFPIGDIRIVGALSPDVLSFLADLNVTPISGALRIMDSTVLRMLRESKRDRQAALPIDDLLRLPEILAAPDVVYYDNDDPALLYVFNGPDSNHGKIVVQINFLENKAKRLGLINSIRSGGILQDSQLPNQKPSGTKHYITMPMPQPPGGTPPSP